LDSWCFWDIARKTSQTKLKVVIENDVVVVLRPEFGEGEVLRKECHQLRRGPVIGKLSCLQVLAPQHGVKEFAAKATPLAAFMHIKVKRANRIDLNQRIAHIGTLLVATSGSNERCCNEEPFFAYLQEAQCRSATDQQIEPLAQKVWRPRCHRFAQTLGGC